MLTAADKFTKTEESTVVARGWGEGDGYRVSVCEDEKVLEVDGGHGCTTLPMYLMNCALKNG